MLLSLAVAPGEGLGPFRLGQTLPDVLKYLRAHRSEYRCVEIKQATPTQDVELRFPDHGFALLFDWRSQRVRLVDVFDPSRLNLRCGAAAVFGGASNPPTFGGVYQAFGPTYPTDPDPTTALQTLLYPGLIALFDPGPSLSTSGGPTPPPAGRAPQASAAPEPSIPLHRPAVRICVFAGRAASAAEALAAAPPPGPPSPADYMGLVEAVPGEGLLLAAGGRAVRLGDSPQDVVSALGNPESVHMADTAAPAAPADYFYNYFARGLDVMFDGGRHSVRKLVLHANAVPHPEFGAYARCNFRLHLGTGWSLAASQVAPTTPDAALAADRAAAAGAPRARSSSSSSSDASPGGDRSGGSGAAEVARSRGSPAASAVAWEQAQGTQHGQRAEQGQSPSRLTAAYNLLVDIMDDVFTVERDGPAGGVAAGPPRGEPQSKQEGRPPKPPPPPSQAGPDVEEGQHGGMYPQLYCPPAPPQRVGTASPRPVRVYGSRRSPSPGTSPSLSGRGALLLLAMHSRRSAAGSATASSADLAAKEERMETGSQYYDGWSDADDLSALLGAHVGGGVGTPPDVDGGGDDGGGGPSNMSASCSARSAAGTDDTDGVGETRCGVARVSVAAQTADDWKESFGGPDEYIGDCGAEQAACGASGSPRSFVSVDVEAGFADGASDFENVPRVRTCSTQTPRHLMSAAAAEQRQQGGASAVAAAAAAAAQSAGAMVTVHSTLADIEAAYGGLGRAAMHPRMGCGPAPSAVTQLYGFPGVVFEVLPDGSIAALTLFDY